MSHSQSFEALVLKTYDVGEADRFCILFTREQGRIAARASGARRVKSRLGGLLLPFQHIQVELKESGNSWIIASASRLHRGDDRQASMLTFAALQEGIELLLRLVPEQGALPDVFDSTMRFIDACRDDLPHASLSFSFTLLHQLGFLPEHDDIEMSLAADDHAYLDLCRAGEIVGTRDAYQLEQLLSLLLEEHLQAPLKTRKVLEMMR